MTFLTGVLSWTLISKIRDSLVSKSITAISVSAMLLTNFEVFFEVFASGQLKSVAVLLGGLMFVLGYIFSLFLSPAEFRSGRSIPQIVGEMVQVSNRDFYSSRLSLLERHLEEGLAEGIWDMPEGRVIHASARLKASHADADMSEWRELQAGLFDADLKVREFSKPRARLTCVFLFGSGLLLLAAPTLISLGLLAVQLLSASLH